MRQLVPCALGPRPDWATAISAMAQDLWRTGVYTLGRQCSRVLMSKPTAYSCFGEFFGHWLMVYQQHGHLATRVVLSKALA